MIRLKSNRSRFLADKETWLGCASLLILMWSYTALDKLIWHEEFTTALERQFFQQSYVLFLSWAIPTGELILVILLLKNSWRKVGFLSSAILLLIFTIYVGLAAFGFRERMPCSCGGVISKLGWNMHLVFNLVFLFLSILGVYLSFKKKGGLVTTV